MIQHDTFDVDALQTITRICRWADQVTFVCESMDDFFNIIHMVDPVVATD